MAGSRAIRGVEVRAHWFGALACVAALPLFTCLSDACLFDPAAAYAHAEETFLHGYLQVAQAEADSGYQRSLASNSDWSAKFLLLEGTTMVWRGTDEELLQLFATVRTKQDKPAPKVEDTIEQSALEATALTRLGRLSEAEQKLKYADGLCAGENAYKACGAVLRAHGKLFMTNGQFAQAEHTYLQTVEFARRSQDRLLEGTALMNLATSISRQDRHDEALALYKSSYDVAAGVGAEDLAQAAQGNQGWEYYSLGDLGRALEFYKAAEARASSLGDTEAEIQSLSVTALVYAGMGQTRLAEETDRRAIRLAQRINHQSEVADAAMDLAQLYLSEGRPDDADRYVGMASAIVKKAGNPLDILTCQLLTGQSAALREDWAKAEPLLQQVSVSPKSQDKMRWDANHALGNMYAAQGRVAAADQAYSNALAIVEAARHSLHHEASQLPFLTNAARIYDDYIHFLVVQGRTDEALEAADWSRARTLQQGLGIISSDASLRPSPLRAKAIARKADATLVFYWMGQTQSYVWAVSPEKTTFASLPAKSEIVNRMQRYRRTLALKDPLKTNNRRGDEDGRELYEMLVAPIAGALPPGRPVILFTDGEMSQLNFETLLVAAPVPHYWIEDATISLAPSIRLLASRSRSSSSGHDKLLLLGDPISTDPALPHLPMAELEVHKVQAKFSPADEAVYSGARATPLAYAASKPEQFSYIHFVAHGTDNSSDPLESAVILSPEKAGGDSYKLFAREILQHPISAQLVTISACRSSGTQFFAGEGAIGLSWAFLRAGAHNTIGALWDVSDASTPELMDRLYSGLQRDEPPAVALREAKLSLLHSDHGFSRPFYWAPFQLYSGH